MIKVEKVLKIEWLELPKDLRLKLRDREAFRNDVSIELHNEVPGDILMSTDDDIRAYVRDNYGTTDEELQTLSIHELLNDSDDACIYRILKLNPEFTESFDSVQLDICW